MGLNRPVYEDWGRDYCSCCGRYSSHLFDPSTVTRNAKGQAIAVYLTCGWSGCQASREVTRSQDWR